MRILKPLDESLANLLKDADGKPVKFETVVRELHRRGAPIFLILLSIPFCLPISIPGLSTPLGLMIAFIGLRMALGKGLYWPRWVLDKEISSKGLTKVVQGTLKGMRRIKKLVRPRYQWITQSSLLNIFNGILVIIFGLLLSLPLPIPFTNYFSALPLLFLGVGLLEDDGLFVVTGYVLGFLGLFFWGLLIFFSKEGLAKFFGLLF